MLHTMIFKVELLQPRLNKGNIPSSFCLFCLTKLCMMLHTMIFKVELLQPRLNKGKVAVAVHEPKFKKEILYLF